MSAREDGSDGDGTAGGELEFIHAEGWARPSGYVNGIVARGRTIFLAGQIGWNPRTHRFDQTDFVSQVRQALLNIMELLRASGAEARHLVRLTWFITDRAEYLAARREIGRVYREVIGMHYPAMSLLVVAALLEDEARVEIEATAVIGDPPSRPGPAGPTG